MATPSLTPDWALDAIRELVDQTTRLSRTLQISMAAMKKATSREEAVQLIEEIELELDGSTAANSEERRKRAKQEADFARHEAESGFPVLHFQAAVTLWAFLESGVRRITTSWLFNKPSLLQGPLFAKLKVPLADYEALAPEDRPSHVVELIERDLLIGVLYGPPRLERLLEFVGLSGPVPERLRRDLLEFAQVRNVLIHKGGVVDSRCLAACPWLSFNVGQHIQLDHPTWSRYTHAVVAYVFLLVCRIKHQFGNDVSEKLASIERYPAIHTEEEGHLTEDG